MTFKQILVGNQDAKQALNNQILEFLILSSGPIRAGFVSGSTVFEAGMIFIYTHRGSSFCCFLLSYDLFAYLLMKMLNKKVSIS